MKQTLNIFSARFVDWYMYVHWEFHAFKLHVLVCNFVIPVHVPKVWTYIYVGKLKHGLKKDKFTDKKYMYM